MHKQMLLYRKEYERNYMDKYIIDANVILLSGTSVKDIPKDQLLCAKKCVDFVKKFMENPKASLVLDAEGRILKEYRGAYTLGKDPNMAMQFSIWVHQHMPRNAEDYISLKELKENEFENYPDSEKLKAFDPPDRKYIALAYNHEEKPPIVEASDSKWWGIREELNKKGMEVYFVDEEYIKEKYIQKIGL